MASYEDEAQMDMIKKEAINELESWLKDMPVEQRTEISLYLGPREFTPEQLLKEMKENREYANTIAQMINTHHIELSKIEQEK